MVMLITIQLGLSFLFLVLGYSVKKGAYWLINGYSSRPRLEQEELIRNGYPQKTGILLIFTGVGMALLLPLLLTPFKYAMEVEFGFMIVSLFFGFIFLSHYEVAAKRKRAYIISTGIAAASLIFVGALMYVGYQDPKLILKSDRFEITGMYGDEWLYKNITEVELLEGMPEITSKVDGFGMSTIAKGRFKANGFGTSLLFIKKGSSPYLHIDTENSGDIFINSDNPALTEKWYENLSGHIAK